LAAAVLLRIVPASEEHDPTNGGVKGMDPEGTNLAAEGSLASGEMGADAPVRRMRYQEAFEFSADAQFVTDRQGVILEANHAAAALLAYSKEFLINKPLALFGVEGERRRFYESLHRLSAGTPVDNFETGFNRRRGSVRRVLLSVRLGARDEVPIFGRRLLWIARDVTEHRQAEADRTNLLLQLSSAQEDERKRLSRDLHDHLGQTVTALVLGIQAVRAADSLPPAALAALDRLQRLAAELGQQVHEIAVRLRPSVLDDLGLEAALRELVGDWSERTGVPANFQAGMGQGRFPPEVETALFRVVQEALTNVAKHAQANRVGVVVARRDGFAVVFVEDDGQGFDPESPAITQSKRLGLVGMRERVSLAGGKLEIESRPSAGTTVYARIQLPPPQITNPTETQEGTDTYGNPANRDDGSA
jgi:PAS domain S-box-containing protein